MLNNFLYYIITTLMNWKSKENYLRILNSVLYIIKNDSIYTNKNLCIIICDSTCNIFKPLADPFFINYNQLNSDFELYDYIKWNDQAFNDDHKDIVIIIKIL